MFRFWTILFCFVSLSATAQEIGTLTLVEGQIQLIRGTTSYTAAEGVRVQEGDLVGTASSGFAQIEFTDGSIAALGSSSTLYVRGIQASAKASGPSLILLEGWLKLQPGQGEAASADLSLARALNTKGVPPAQPLRTYHPSTRGLVLVTDEAKTIMHSTTSSSEAFIETGISAEVFEARPDGGYGAANTTKTGEFVVKLDGKPVSIYTRPSTEFLAAIPRAFKDALPSRVRRFDSRRVEPLREHDANYEEVSGLLTLPVRWRDGLVLRFKPRLHDANFRKALAANLKRHPEWTPILYPPKPKVTTTDTPSVEPLHQIDP